MEHNRSLWGGAANTHTTCWLAAVYPKCRGSELGQCEATLRLNVRLTAKNLHRHKSDAPRSHDMETDCNLKGFYES